VTVAEALKLSSEYLSERGVPSPRVDAEQLLAHSLGLQRLDLYLDPARALTQREAAACRGLVERRGEREPLAYLLGAWGFRRLVLRVDRRALIPRPETEIVVERCLALLGGVAEPEVLDVGTGTGAIALALAEEAAGARVTAIDASAEAVALAAENVGLTGLGERVDLVLHDLHAGLPGGPYDLVVSNPPYVDPELVDGLQPEVRDWEPREALVDRGATSAVASGAAAVLRTGGWLVLEVADGRAPEVAAELAALGYGDVRSTADLAGSERVVEGRWEP
jgi:release factor glutamine methyltransferase